MIHFMADKSNGRTKAIEPFYPEMGDKIGRQTSSPCAACKLLRRRCAENCVLAPFFPQSDPQRFADAHRVFGASNLVKMLEEIPVEKRADAASSMVYEASARLRDPVYGCAGTVWQLQQQVSKLQSEKAMLQAQLLHMHLQHANLVVAAAAFIVKGDGEVGGGKPPAFAPDTFSSSPSNIIIQGGGGSSTSDQLHSARSDDQEPQFWT